VLATLPVDLAPLRAPLPRTWVRTLQDLIVTPDRQLRYAAHAGVESVVDLDAGHRCMVGAPEQLAAILTRIAADPGHS
jgi:pimeloyl-ACP methyl ester carboxylesterase